MCYINSINKNAFTKYSNRLPEKNQKQNEGRITVRCRQLGENTALPVDACIHHSQF
jgi:hypothetical protein